MDSPFPELDALQKEWLSLQPLPADRKETLWRKLRLEWNYNSNHIEGNTLTYGETELFFLHNQTKGNHTLREYEEMKAHDAAITLILEQVERGEVLSEVDIRNLNKVLLKEPFWKDAATASGQATSHKVIPGDYKNLPNSVRTESGELFQYAVPADVNARMYSMVARLRTETENPTVHPLILAAQTHHDFEYTHPFDDGNGRVGRLITNFVLMRAGYPPIIIRSADKVNYIRSLRSADAGDINPLVQYFAQAMKWSLDMSIRAAKGLSIAEQGDLTKRITLFVRNFSKAAEVKPFSGPVAVSTFDTDIVPLATAIHERMSLFSPLFFVNQILWDEKVTNLAGLGPLFASFLAASSPGLRPEHVRVPNAEFVIVFKLDGFKGDPNVKLTAFAHLGIKLEKFRYGLVLYQNAQTVRTDLQMYGNRLSTEYINEFADLSVTPAMDYIEKMAGLSMKLPS